MLKVTNLSETSSIQPLMLRSYIAKKMTSLLETYQTSTLDDIGCFIVFEQSETASFNTAEMEYVELLVINETAYLHGVRILGDSYGEELFLPVEVIRI